MANPDRLGEFKKLYYQFGDYDLTALDATILGDANWVEMCNSTISISSDINSYEILDTCSGDIIGQTPGREGFTFDVTMYNLRLTDSMVQGWLTAMDDRGIIAFLGMVDDIAEASNWGFIGNFVRINESEDQPDSGPMTITYTFAPAARSAYIPLKRRIYGSGIT